MPIIKSAKKRVRVSNKAAVRNSKTKRSLKTALKAFQGALTSGKKDAAELHSTAQSNLDKAAKKGVMHPNKVARQKRQLAARAKAAGVTVAGSGAKKAAAPKKTAAKAAPVKKAAAPKKAAAKPAAKAPAKKPAAKK